MPAGLVDHLKKDTSQEADGIGRMIKQESLLQRKSSFLEEMSSQKPTQSNRFSKDPPQLSKQKPPLTGYQPATPPNRLHDYALLWGGGNPDERGPIPTLELSDPEEIQHNTHTSHDPASEELDEELNDFYSNRIELEELLIHEVAFDRSSSEAELDITAIASREAGVIMLVTDRLELYSYDLRSGQKQLCHVFEESAFQHHLERLKTRKREKVSIDNLLAFGKDSFIILVSGNLFRFDTSSKAVELLIPGRQEKEQLLLEGRNGSPQRTQPSGPE